MKFVDTHCHLNFQCFHDDLHQVVDRALASGVDRIVVPGTDLFSSKIAVELAEKFPPIFAAIGVHPTEIDSFDDSQLEGFVQLLGRDKVVAVGEIGLDYYHRSENKTRQKSVFRQMLELAVMFHKPVILHSRNSLPDLVSEITGFQADNPLISLKGVYHAFEGNLADATMITNQGFLLGAGGPVTYTNAQVKHQLFSKIELKYILLETDSPFLTPQLHRGKRNEPGYIPLIANKLAELQSCCLTDVAASTTRNANLLFDWKE